MDDCDPSGPAVLVAHDPMWAGEARRHLDEIRRALVDVVDDVGACTFDHIGSTSVPGLAAKNIVDLQACMPTMPGSRVLDATLGSLGWLPAVGSRADSPGVTWDIPAPQDDEPDWVWTKRLFTMKGRRTPALLHLRFTASPFGRRTVAFRDRLRAEPDLRAGYERLKHQLAAAHADARDYDDYTHGKSTFIRGAAGT